MNNMFKKRNSKKIKENDVKSKGYDYYDETDRLDALRYLSSMASPTYGKIDYCGTPAVKTEVDNAVKFFSDNIKNSFNTPIEFTKDQEEYFEMMRKKVIKTEGKNFEVNIPDSSKVIANLHTIKGKKFKVKETIAEGDIRRLREIEKEYLENFGMTLDQYRKSLDGSYGNDSREKFDLELVVRVREMEAAERSAKKLRRSYTKRNNSCCDSPNKYKNIISNNLQFYACRNCGADLGDI